ncbi:hypothetical protein FHY55_17005 [Oceanicola sp. D3]|uniref:hypothetical protein n=1 Tax=Oceanicola sp. D3 TaxID=2587163 RepID=UPI00111D3827|nr:hypothetical protein [Oceanicola sp. D3]QDC10828.1 hypothetical protein FHY55_17005 [Oceanicola sp. D3]
MKSFAIIAVVALLLAGCTTDALISTAYPDRERFRFRNSDGDALTYLCAPGADAKARATKAHRYTDAQLTAVAKWAAGHIVNGTATSRQISARINAVAEKTVEETERRYKCLMIDAS